MRLIVLLSLLWPHGPALAIDVAQACDAAAARAERDMGVPAGVLAAVGTVESGIGGGVGGAAPWPWTTNAVGQGAHYASKAEGVAAVLTLMSRGYPMIDIGCFQIDILYHAGVFRSLDEAFDPDRNAQEAARILLAEHARGADWATAVAHYHSANPEHGLPYLQRVRAALPASRTRATTADLYRSLLDRAARPEAASSSLVLPRVVYALPIADIGPEKRRSERHRPTLRFAGPARVAAAEIP